MSDLNDKTLEMAEKLQNSLVEEKIKQASARQCDRIEFRDWDGEHCFDCGEPYHKDRVEAGRVRCVPCQEVVERRGRS